MLDVSQNSVRLMPATSAGGGSRRTARSRAALVTPVSSHMLTAGTPVTITTGKPASGRRVILSGDLAPDHE